MRGSLFTFAAGRRTKWIPFGIWLLAIFVAAVPANLPGKFADAESNEATSYLPGSAESTDALDATESLQDGELAPAVIVYRRESGLTGGDRRTIVDDVAAMTGERFPGVVADGETAAAGGQKSSEAGSTAASAPANARSASSVATLEFEEELVASDGSSGPACGGPTTEIPGQPRNYAPFVGPVCSPDGKAAIVTAYVAGNGEGDRILDPVKAWREEISDPGGGLEVKITGGGAGEPAAAGRAPAARRRSRGRVRRRRLPRRSPAGPARRRRLWAPSELSRRKAAR